MSIDTERRGRILVIHMQREAKRNAIDVAMTSGIDAALNMLDDDHSLWAGVLTGTPSVFCAGTDLKDGPGNPTPRGGEYGIIRRRRVKPLIAAVEGLALGGGFEIVLACDLVVAARDAKFGLPEVARGVIASCGALFRTSRALPLNLARELLITGEPITAERGHAFGLVNALAEPGAALERAVAMAEAVCRNAPVSVRESLRAVNRVVESQDAQAWQATAEAVAAVVASRDCAEGVRAFLEKRAPVWEGF
ncbi:MAG: enoyl-CoA hydratase-related protein [Gammaproteobacteria bacterium]